MCGADGAVWAEVELGVTVANEEVDAADADVVGSDTGNDNVVAWCWSGRWALDGDFWWFVGCCAYDEAAGNGAITHSVVVEGAGENVVGSDELEVDIDRPWRRFVVGVEVDV